MVAQRGIRHQFSKYDKIVCRTNNPLPDTIQAEHLSQLAEMESCEAENLYFSLYDRGSKSTIATNVTGEYILPFGSRKRVTCCLIRISIQ